MVERTKQDVMVSSNPLKGVLETTPLRNFSTNPLYASAASTPAAARSPSPHPVRSLPVPNAGRVCFT